jgi:hypothetical protein
MNFRKATDALLESVTLDDLAEEMGVSLQALRQARAAENTTSHRSPPVGWEASVRRLAERQQLYFKRLSLGLTK